MKSVDSKACIMENFDLQEKLLNQRLAQAQALKNQEFTMPQGQMVSGRYVRPGIAQSLVQGLRMYGGMKEGQAAEQELKDLQNRRMGANQSVMVNALRMMGGAPADEALPEGVQGPVRGPQAPDMRGAYAELMKSPDYAQAGFQGMMKLPELEAQAKAREDERAFKAQEAQAARDARIQQMQEAHQLRMEAMQAQNASRADMMKAQQEFQAMMAQQERENRLLMQKMIAQNRPERMITVMGANGEPISMPQSQAQGMTPYTPAAAAQFQKNKTKTQAKEELSGVVQQLNNSYDALEKGGGITSTGRGALSNLGTSISSSGVGQLLGGAFGTENQRQRQEIQQTRPLLLNLIKEATGMSAQQMNSNAEMMLYLQAATDPTLTVEANRSALANLDRMFGLGLAKRPEDKPKVPSNARKFEIISVEGD